MPNITFTDNNALILNPDRGQIMEPRFLFSTIDQMYWQAWDNTYGNLEKIWFANPPYVHEVGKVIKWMRNGVVIGEATVHSWDHDFNVIVHTVVGEFAEPGDLLINHDINSFNYISDFITWRELEPTEGVYDWDYIDQKLMKQFCIDNNKQLRISFCMDYPTLVDHMDIPDWLYTQLGGAGVAGATYQFDEVGNIKKGFSPDYTNPILIAKHATAIAAIKNHFGHYIHSMEIGSVGHWGEFHTWPQTSGLGSMPPNNISAQYIQHYLDNFPNTQLGIRRPINKATVEGIGLYFQMLGGPEHLYNATWGLLATAANGYTDDYGNVQDPYPNFRAMSPVGGEHDPFVDDETWEADFSNNATGRSWTRTLQMITDLEMSLCRSHPDVHLYRTDGIALKANADEFSKILGYRFVLKDFAYTVNGANLDVTVQIENVGVARCYKSYPVYVEFYDSSNVFLARQNLNADLKTVLAGTTQTFTASVPYPTCDKIAFKIEGVTLPITAPTIGDGAYTMFTVHLDGVIADTPIGTFKVAKGGQVMEPVPLYAVDATSVTDKCTRIGIPGNIPALFNLVDTSDPNASAIRVSTPGGIKSVKK